MSIGKRFEEIMQNYGLNANSFAKHIDANYTTVRSVAKGESKPGYDLLHKIAMKLPELNGRWLLTGEGEMMNPEIYRFNESIEGYRVKEPLEPYGKTIKEIIDDKNQQIAELRELLRLKERLG